MFAIKKSYLKGKACYQLLSKDTYGSVSVECVI